MTTHTSFGLRESNQNRWYSPQPPQKGDMIKASLRTVMTAVRMRIILLRLPVCDGANYVIMMAT